MNMRMLNVKGTGMYRYLIPCIVESVQGRLGDDVGYVVNGRQRWRRYVKPANPRTWSQLRRRRHFARLVSRWRAMDEAGRERWNERARLSGRKRFRGFNLFLSTGMREYEDAMKIRALRDSLNAPVRRRFVRRREGVSYGTALCPALFAMHYSSPVLMHQRE